MATKPCSERSMTTASGQRTFICKLSDIEKVRKVTYEGKVHYEITAKGKTFRTDN